MFLHVDESGNSGNNLFDQNQPVLSYGVLSSRWDVDLHAESEQRTILTRAGAQGLHANELGTAGLGKIADLIAELHERFEFCFDYYYIHKPSFAVVTFFNAVFDAGINPAMKWDWYWTPLRFPLVGVLDSVLDEALLRESWRLCMVPRSKLDLERESIRVLLTAVLERLERNEVPERLREILVAGLKYGVKNPREMDFGIYSPTALSPNTIGFQFVLSAIAYRQKIHRQAVLGITVDRQTQFNGAQVKTYEIQSKMSAALRGNGIDRVRYLANPFLADVREDTQTLIDHFPQEQLKIEESGRSFGLQITDAYLWLLNRYIKTGEVVSGFEPILESVLLNGMIDGISMRAMANRWRAFERQLPAFADVTAEQRAAAQKMIDEHRDKVESLNLK
jgi:Protein of unknown function (DUF3800)